MDGDNNLRWLLQQQLMRDQMQQQLQFQFNHGAGLQAAPQHQQPFFQMLPQPTLPALPPLPQAANNSASPSFPLPMNALMEKAEEMSKKLTHIETASQDMLLSINSLSEQTLQKIDTTAERMRMKCSDAMHKIVNDAEKSLKIAAGLHLDKICEAGNSSMQHLNKLAAESVLKMTNEAETLMSKLSASASTAAAKPASPVQVCFIASIAVFTTLCVVPFLLWNGYPFFAVQQCKV